MSAINPKADNQLSGRRYVSKCLLSAQSGHYLIELSQRHLH